LSSHSRWGGSAFRQNSFKTGPLIHATCPHAEWKATTPGVMPGGLGLFFPKAAKRALTGWTRGAGLVRPQVWLANPSVTETAWSLLSLNGKNNRKKEWRKGGGVTAKLRPSHPAGLPPPLSRNPVVSRHPTNKQKNVPGGGGLVSPARWIGRPNGPPPPLPPSPAPCASGSWCWQSTAVKKTNKPGHFTQRAGAHSLSVGESLTKSCCSLSAWRS
jgi:hypothetical protein